MDTFVITYGLLAGIIGAVVGGISGWRKWHRVKALLLALGLFVVAMFAEDLVSGKLPTDEIVFAIVLGAVFALVPTWVGVALGRALFRGKKAEQSAKEPSGS
jgi:hypothetical protein